jgi:hypothetical protein
MLSMWKTRLPTTTLQVIMAFNCLPLLELANVFVQSQTRA